MKRQGLDVGWSRAWITGVGPGGGTSRLCKHPPPTLHPDPTEKVRQRWQDDELFGYQFLNGTNPMLLRRCTSLPSRLVLPSGMEELRTQLEKELQVPLPPCVVLSLAVWPEVVKGRDQR